MNPLSPKYPKESAGSLMTSRVPLILQDQNLDEVKLLLSTQEKGFDTINYLYVVDKDTKLVGVISVKDIFSLPDKIKVNEIMTSSVVRVDPLVDQEKVAAIALKNNLKAIPVVDKENHFLGVIDSDTILNVLHKEHVEDFLLHGGIPKMTETHTSIEIMQAPIPKIVKARCSWLLLGLFGGVIAAQIIGFFENTLREEILLAFFIPLVVYATNAVAIQTQTLFIRGLTLETPSALKKYFLKELAVGSLLGLIMGSFLGLIATLWWNSLRTGIILFSSMFFGVTLAVVVAILIPLILKKFKQDPAIGAGPFSTIITDIISIIIFFLIADFLISIL